MPYAVPIPSLIAPVNVFILVSPLANPPLSPARSGEGIAPRTRSAIRKLKGKERGEGRGMNR